jgi:cytochrome P450 family 135
MRLCPAAPIVVRKLEPMELGGYTIPAGTTVAPCVHLVHRRPDIYPEPQRYMPERFLEHPAGTYTWIPFDGGVRRCLAASYAQLLMKQVISTVIGEVDLRPAEPRSERPRKSAIAFVPHRHARVIAEARERHTANGTATAPDSSPAHRPPATRVPSRSDSPQKRLELITVSPCPDA